MPDTLETRTVASSAAAAAAPEIVVGTVSALGDDGVPLVDWPGNAAGVACPAMTTAPVSARDVGRAAALLFAGGDPRRPVIVGLIRQPLDVVFDATEAGRVSEGGPGIATVTRDGERLTLSAEKEVVIECGKASITLTRAGKIVIRGEYVLSRSSGVNQVKGAAIKLN